MIVAYVLLVIVQFCFAVPLVISQVALEQIPLFLYLELSFIAGFVVLFILSSKIEKIKWTQLGKKNYAKLFLQGFLINGLLNLFLLYGISHTSGTATGIINSTTPAIVLILSFFLLRERIKFLSILAILFAILGVSLQAFVSVGESPNTSVIGNISVFLGVLTQGFFLIYSKKFAADVPPIAASTIITFVGVLLYIPLAIMDGNSLEWSTVSATSWLICIMFGLIGNALAFVCYYTAIKRVHASTVGIFAGLVPILTTVTAVLALGEPFSLLLLVSVCCVVVSILLAVFAERRITTAEVALNDHDQPSLKI